MEKSRFWNILARVKSGEATPEEQLELSQHLSAFPDDMELVKQIDACWDLPLPAAAAPGEDEMLNAWERVRQRMGGLPRVSGRGKIRRMQLYAAAVAALFIMATGAGWWWYAFRQPTPPQKNVVSTRNGSKSKIELPDGTQVWLNAGSRIKYDENYGRQNRELTLTGEAYFDVAHDAGKPFILHTGKMDIKVLGTVFNVKAYPTDEVSEAALIKGAIEVTFPDRPQEKLILKPRDKISVANKTVEPPKNTTRVSNVPVKERPAIMLSSIQYEPADSAIIETAWVNNKLIFRSKTFEELVNDIERWFNVTLKVEDSTILSKTFTGTFSSESITDALDYMSMSYPFRYKLDKKKNIVTIIE
jgi:Fe2+-dicitrate sensor, membrane component